MTRRVMKSFGELRAVRDGLRLFHVNQRVRTARRRCWVELLFSFGQIPTKQPFWDIQKKESAHDERERQC